MIRKTLFVSVLVAGSLGAGFAAQAQFVAGVNPAERPAGAPVITEYSKDAGWYARVLTGVSAPYPSSLRFLEDQGAWFNPFLHPGMTGPYDIRNWHSPE
jgi:hypothetical protein